MPAAGGVGQVGFQYAVVGGGVVPGLIHRQAGEDGALHGQPIAPTLWAAVEVEITGDAQLGGQGVKGGGLFGVELAGAEGQHLIGDHPKAAGDIQGGFEAGALQLDEGGRAGDKLVGFFGGHPHIAHGKGFVLGQAAGFDEVPAQYGIGAGPPHAGAGAALVAHRPPGFAQIHFRRQLGGRSDQVGV